MTCTGNLTFDSKWSNYKRYLSIEVRNRLKIVELFLFRSMLLCKFLMFELYSSFINVFCFLFFNFGVKREIESLMVYSCFLLK